MLNEDNQISYYAIIPATVRYDERLKAAEKLIYGEITSLTNKFGYCFATNKYFSNLYKVTPHTVSSWISHLEKKGYISVDLIRGEKKEIKERRIYIRDAPYVQNNTYPYVLKSTYPMYKNVQDNINIKIDILFNYIIKKQKQNLIDFTQNEEKQFWKILEKMELNYTEEIINGFTKENVEKIKVMIYALKQLCSGPRKNLLGKLNREKLIIVYDNCKNKQLEYNETNKEIKNFFEYYYISLIKNLEQS